MKSVRVCWGSVRPLPGSWFHQKDSQNSETGYTQLQFIIVKEYRLELAKEKGAQGRAQEELGASFQLFCASEAM